MERVNANSGDGLVYERRFAVRLQHVDAAGVVFFARYFELAHEVYEEFLEDLGHGIAAAIDKGEIIIPIGSAEARYLKPLRHGETITARLKLIDLRGSSFAVVTSFFGVANDARAVITTGHVCVSQASFKPTPLPEDLKSALRPYLSTADEDARPRRR
jgi:YbgC/YbaW family acyl-CoA thioester hydrolase